GAAGGSSAAAPSTTSSAPAATPVPAPSDAATGGRSGRQLTGSVLDHLSEATVLLDVDGASRDDVVRRLVELGAATGQVQDVDAVVAAALAREGQGTTGVGQGIAIPHAKSAEVSAPLVAFARSTEGVEWESMD